MRLFKPFVRLASLALFYIVSINTLAQIDGTLTGNYMIYSGGIGDPQNSIRNEKKIAIEIDGKAAKEIFNAIGPDVPDVCGASADLRIRKKNDGALSCSRSFRGEYRCHIGFDLQSGKSIGGVVC
jgi:hypothetical protein